ncbi:MAG: hypothetical protein JNM68_04615 [Dinghuibacter sp.]|nr:hypothetical protein [Dinghuibacter sp.]
MKALKLMVALGCFAWVFTSCSKELSFEDPIGAQGQGPIIGNNCQIKKVIEFDTISKTGLTAINYDFSASTGRLNSLVEFDSIGQNVVYTAFFTYNTDTIRIDAAQYFVVNNAGRVIKFSGLDDPYDPFATMVDIEYTYDNNGRLIKRAVTDPTIQSTPIIQSVYAYTGSNLTGIAVSLVSGVGVTAPLYNITLGYQFDRVPRNYMNILPDCRELRPYIAALNMGQKSLNPVNKIDVTLMDPFTGTPISTSTTQYTNYSFSRDGYVLGFDMSGNAIDALPFAPGRNNFEYFCR